MKSVLSQLYYAGGKWIAARLLLTLTFFGLLIYGVIRWIPAYTALNYGRSTEVLPTIPSWYSLCTLISGSFVLTAAIMRTAKGERHEK